MKKLIIIGAGGFAKSIIDGLDLFQYEIEGFIDTFKEGNHFGYKIIGKDLNSLEKIEKYEYFIAIGDPIDRKKWFDLLKEKKLNLINIVDKTALVSRRTKLGEGIYIGKMAIINADVKIEDNVVINTRALIEHGNEIGKHSNISTNAVLNGDVKIGEGVFIGSCAVINGQIKIGENVIVGSGSVVIKNIKENVVVAGSPTKIIRQI